ncbi:MAG: hypothetical protein ABFR82_13000 [Nitrospirota bacterium]
MLKTLSRFFFISLILAFAGCAPKVAPPPQYLEKDLSLEEIISKVSSDVEVMKAITDIRIEKNNEPYDFVNASVLVKRPGWLHMRIYKFGMLVKDFVIKDNNLYVLSGKGGDNLKKLGNEFYNAIFWWDDMHNAVMHRKGDEYIVKSEKKEIHIDSATLLPVKQEITAFSTKIDINYDKPKKDENGFWYSSEMEIYIGDFKFSVNLKKLLKNPSLGEFDFRVPVKS